MMKIKHLLFAVAFSATVLFLSGCGDYVGKEKSHPLFVKAGASRVAGNYKESAQYFEEFLYVCPKSPLAHYELASVYSDNLDDPFRAMYHYDKYLELSPDGTDAEDVRKFIESCRKRIFERLAQTYETADAEKAYQETARVRQTLEKYVEYAGKLKEQNDEMRKLIQSGKIVRQVTVQPLRNARAPETVSPGDSDPAWDNASVAVTTNSPGSSAVSPVSGTGTAPAASAPTAASGTASSSSAIPATYVVKQGDSLSKISRAIYGATKYYPLILNANRAQIGSNAALKVGQKLVIPPLPAGAGGAR